MKRLIVELDDDLHTRIKVKAAQKNLSIKSLVTLFLKRWVNNKKENT